MKPTKRQVILALENCCDHSHNEDVEGVLEAFRPSKKGLAFALTKAICEVRGYYTKEEFEIFLKCTEESLDFADYEDYLSKLYKKRKKERSL